MKTLTRRGALAPIASMIALPALASRAVEAEPDPEMVALARQARETFEVADRHYAPMRAALDHAREKNTIREDFGEICRRFNSDEGDRLWDAYNHAKDAMWAAMRAQGKIAYIAEGFLFIELDPEGELGLGLSREVGPCISMELVGEARSPVGSV